MSRAPWSSTRRKPWTPITHSRIHRKLAAQSFKLGLGTCQRGEGVAPLCRPRLTCLCAWHFLDRGEMAEACWTKDRWNLLVYVARCHRILIRKKSQCLLHESFWVSLSECLWPSLGLTCFHHEQFPHEGVQMKNPLEGLFVCHYKQEERANEDNYLLNSVSLESSILLVFYYY